MSGRFGGESSRAARPQQKQQSVDGLMLGGNLVDREIELGESNSVGLGMGGAGAEWDAQFAQRRQRKRQREAESVQDQMERALDFLKQEAERAEEAHLSQERAREQQRHQQQLWRHQQEELARAQSGQDAEFAQEWAQRPDLLAQAHDQSSAREGESAIQQAELAQERAQRARLLESRSAEFPGFVRPFRGRALWSQRAEPARDAEMAIRAQWARLFQRPDLLAQAHDQQPQSARYEEDAIQEAELSQGRARPLESRSAEFSGSVHPPRRRALWSQRAQSARNSEMSIRAQWARRLQCPISDVASVLRQRPDLLARAHDRQARELAQERHQRAQLLERQSAEFAQWSQRALLLERAHAEYARVIRHSSAQPHDQRRLSEQVISAYLEPRVRPSRDQDKDEICPVCLDHLYDEGNKIHGGIVTLDCKHEYHRNCTERWLLRKNVCPLCNRTSIPC